MKLSQAILLASLIAPLAAFADVKEEVDYNFDVNSGANFKLENVNGDIEISGWDQPTITVHAIKSAADQDAMDRIEIVVDATPDHVSIDTKYEKGKSGWFNWSNGDKGQVKYIVQAPHDVVLRLVETVNGDVEVSGISGDAKVETVNGDIAIQGLTGYAKIETVNGEISARFERFDGSQEASFETVNGAITVYLPSDANASVNAETLNGSIKNDFGLSVEKSFASREARGNIGSGGGRLSMETVNGSVSIRAQ